MKRTFYFLCACISLTIFVSASVWEGAATIARNGETPDAGLYIATNSFPLNTVVNVTNLENGVTVRLVVSSRLESPGLLAVLSREAANAIGVENSLARIRMSQGSDSLVFSHFRGIDGSFPGDPDFDPALFAELHSIDYLLFNGIEPIAVLPEETLISTEETFASEPEQPHDTHFTDFALTLVPAEDRPPQSDIAPLPEHFIDPVREPLFIEPPPAPQPMQMFSVPLISRLEPGKYYVQIGAFSRVEAVESEINRIDRSLPVAIMNAGTDANPIFRILIGPVNLGESGAIMHRFRTTHSDAFVRHGR